MKNFRRMLNSKRQIWANLVILVASLVAVFAILVQSGIGLVSARSSQHILQTTSSNQKDIILVIDESESMTYDAASGSLMGDPKVCNETDPTGAEDGIPGECHPFEEVKAAALLFVDHLNFPNARVGIVTFDRQPTLVLPFSNDVTTIKNAIKQTKVYEGGDPANGIPSLCPYTIETAPSTPINPSAPCRLYSSWSGQYIRFDCLGFPSNAPSGDPSRCTSTNIGGGLLMAGNMFAGTPLGGVRPGALPVVVLLSDGAANAAYDTSGNPICPAYTWTRNPSCRDMNATAAGRHTASQTALYDADDYARDMADTLTNGQNALIFTVGLGPLVTDTRFSDPGTPAAGEALLRYIAERITISSDNPGTYYYTPTGAGLEPIFLQIANELVPPPTVVSINRANPDPTSSASVQFTTTFSEPVTGVDINDFKLETTGVTGATITAVNEADALYTVTVNTGSQNGTLRLDVTDDDSIISLSGVPLGGTGAGNGDFTTGQVYTVNKVMTFTSAGALDGWVRESSEKSNRGGTLNSASARFFLGDDARNRQYRAILSFNTATLPDNAVITKATLKIKQAGLVGTDPFTTHGNIAIDIHKGFFGTSKFLQLGDFQSLANLSPAGLIKNTPTDSWYSANLLKKALPHINLSGLTQFRLRFQLADNDDMNADYIKFYSGEAGAANRPQLIIEYYVP